MQSASRSLCCFVLGVLSAPMLSAQPLKFEAASIKLAGPSEKLGGSVTSNSLTTTAQPLIGLIRFAYDMRVYQVEGAPDWLSQELYDVNAKAEGDRAFAVNQIRQMTQALLADRLQFRAHREATERPVYILIVGKNGSRLKESSDQSAMPGFSKPGHARFTFPSSTMAHLAATLSSRLDRPVLDRTRLSGRYNFQLEYSPEAPGLEPNSPPASIPLYPSIFTAIQEQLGLKLEPAKDPVDTLVIDHVEKPSKN